MEKRTTKSLITLMISSLLSSVAIADISGVVYTDYNLNGVQDLTDTPVKGAVINAVCEDGTTPTFTTLSDGAYTLTVATGGDKCRIEVDTSGLGTLGAGANAAGDGTLVNIIADTATHNISLSSPATYCQALPDIAMATIPETDTSYPSLFTVPQPAATVVDDNTALRVPKAAASETGAIWGLAWAKNTQQLYSAASVRRYADVLGDDAGAIYVTDNATNTTALLVSVPSVGYSLSGRDLTPNQDTAIWPLAGRVGLGDLDISEDETDLYTVNLFSKELVIIDIATQAITNVAIPSPYTAAECPPANVRPWALTVKGDDVYIGSVCGTNINDGSGAGIGAKIQKYDGTSVSATAIATTSTLGYLRPPTYGPNLDPPQAYFRYQNHNWVDNYPTVHQPVLVDLAFDNNSDLILSYLDRGVLAGIAAHSNGDIRRMCLETNGSYTDENTAIANTSCPSTATTFTPPTGPPRTYYEHYIGEEIGGASANGGHPEIALGGIAMAPGASSVVLSAWNGGTTFNTGVSVLVLDNTSGVKTAGRSIVADVNPERAIYNGKEGGMGDIEVLCDPSPIEIGNYVWLDADGDGEQDPEELAIADGTTVTLHDAAGTQIGTTTTVGGHYYFGGLSDHGMTTGSVEANTPYEIRIDRTQASIGSATSTSANSVSDNIDSDGVDSGNNAIIAVTTGNPGENSHTLDFGFALAATVQIGNLIWIEDNNDGNPATGTISYPPAGTVVTATASDGTTTYTGTTDASGAYLIDVPENDTYVVTVATPAGTLPTAGSTDNSVPDTTTENNLSHDGVGGTTVVITTVDNLTLDFGFTSPVQIGDLVWIENDNDGNPATGTISYPPAGTVVTATASDGTTTYTGTTDASGAYLIDVPANDTYVVTVSTPAGTLPTAGSTDNSVPDTTTENNLSHDGVGGTTVVITTVDNLTLDFGFTSPVQIGDLVWIEDNNDGNPATGTISYPPAGTVVTATASDGTTTYTGTTDASGAYLIDVPANDTYVVTVATPVGTAPTLGSDDNSVPDTTTENNLSHDGVGGTTVVITTVDNLTLDFGFVPTVTIGNLIWIEDDNDGNPATGNITYPPAGTVVTATSPDGRIYTGMTDANGVYGIDVPINTTYIVTISPPAGNGPTNGSDDSTGDDPDNQTHNGLGTEVIVGTVANPTIDFGFSPLLAAENIPTLNKWALLMLILSLGFIAYRRTNARKGIQF